MSDVEISSQDIEGWLVANANGLTVALDVTISDELKKEGIARELVNRIQNEVIAQAIADNGEYIKAETLAKGIIFEADIQNGVVIEFDDIKTKIQIQKV